MRNLKKVLSLALAMVMLIGMMVVGASATTFSDDADIKNQEAVDVVSGIGILTGIGDGSFNPTGTLTRAEAAVVVSKLDLGAAFGNLETTNAATFDDVGPNHWGKAYIDYCAARGLIAGDGNGKFMPDETVTGVEFALMVSRVLGYEDENEAIGGADWEVEAAALARKAGLTKDVILSSMKGISRDDMAQVAYNALQADMVYYSNRAIIIGDVTIPAGKASTLGSNGTNFDGISDGELQLCEEKFPNLRLSKSTADYNGRPSNVWTYGTNNVISSVAHAATFEIKNSFTGSKLATTLGQAPLEAGYRWTYYVDGVQGDASTLRYHARTADVDTPYSGQGATTYIYVDDTVGRASVIVCVVKTYGGEVTKTTDTNVTVDGMTYASTAFEEDDVVLYTKGYDYVKNEEVITSMEAAEKVEGTLSKVTSDTSFVVDDTTYRYNATLVTNYPDDVMKGENVRNDVSFYVDHDGNMLYRGDVITNVDYAVVLKIVKRENTFGDPVYYARLLKTNGTVSEVVVNKASSWTAADGSDARNDMEGYIVAYSESDGRYTLTKPATGRNNPLSATLDTAGQLVIAQGVSRMTLGTGVTGYADDNTVFLVNNGDSYSVYKGYKNVPTITVDASHTGSVASYCRGTGNKAVVVYVDGANVDTSTSDDIIFVVGNPNTKLITESNGKVYYEFKAVVDGEATTIQVKSDTDLAGDLLADVVLTFKSLRTNSRGLVTEAYAHDNPPEIVRNGTRKISNSVISFGEASYAYDNDTMIVKFDGSDLTVGNANLVKNDDNDRVWVVEKEGKLLAAFIKEVAEGATDNTGTGPSNSEVGVDIDAYNGTITVNHLYGAPEIDEAREAEAALVAAGYTITGRNPHSAPPTITASRNGVSTIFQYNAAAVEYFRVTVNNTDYYVKANGTQKDGTALQLTALNKRAEGFTGTGTGYAIAKGDADATYGAYVSSNANASVVKIAGTGTAVDDNYVIETGYVKVTVNSDVVPVAVNDTYTATKPVSATGTGFKKGESDYVKYGDSITVGTADVTLTSGYVKLDLDGEVSALDYHASNKYTTPTKGTGDHGTGFKLTQGDTESYVAYGDSSACGKDKDIKLESGYVNVSTVSDTTLTGATIVRKIGSRTLTPGATEFAAVDDVVTITITFDGTSATNEKDTIACGAGATIDYSGLEVTGAEIEDANVSGGTLTLPNGVTKVAGDLVVTYTVGESNFNAAITMTAVS